MIYESKHIDLNNLENVNSNESHKSINKSSQNNKITKSIIRDSEINFNKFIILILSNLLKDKYWFIVKPTVPQYQIWTLLTISSIAFLIL